MGMYTELVVATQVRNVPEAIAVLQFMAGVTETTPPLPEHALFQTDRWDSLFTCNSHYFVPLSVVKLQYNDIAGAWSLISRADLKNYDNEVEKFIDWIRPYLDCSPGQMFAYSRYEEAAEPTIYYA